MECENLNRQCPHQSTSSLTLIFRTCAFYTDVCDVVILDAQSIILGAFGHRLLITNNLFFFSFQVTERFDELIGRDTIHGELLCIFNGSLILNDCMRFHS